MRDGTTTLRLRAVHQAADAGARPDHGGLLDAQRLLERRNKPYIRSGTRPFTRLRSTIEYKQVSFRYAEGGLPALNNITCRIRRHQATAIVGASGAGKSKNQHDHL